MEFLFTVEWASTEAILVLICVGIFVAIFAYDGYLYLRRALGVFFPKKTESLPPEVVGVFEVPIPKQEKEEEIEQPWEKSPLVVETPSQPKEVEESPIINNDDILEMNVSGDVQSELDTNKEEEKSESEWDTPLSDSIENLEVTVPSEDIHEIQGEIIQETEAISEEKVDESTSPGTIEETPVTQTGLEVTASPQTEPEEVEISNPGEVIQEILPQKTETPKINNTEVLFAIVNNVRTLIARWQTLEARGLIIQGLALDKDNRELNMMLAGLYEQDHHFEKAEYIYKDLALMYPNDIEILEKLWNVLIIERRYEIALEMYKKILELTGETEWTLYILTHLSSELGQHEATYTYSKKYQKQWPNNPEILNIIAHAEIVLGKRQDAIQTLIKLKNLTPYNQEIADLIQKLVLEEELAGNFGEEK